jgi:hypothetical protein
MVVVFAIVQCLCHVHQRNQRRRQWGSQGVLGPLQHAQSLCYLSYKI